MTDDVQSLWVESCAALLTLVDDTAVAERWDAPSCLPGMTIGALCGHVIASGIFEVESRVTHDAAVAGSDTATPSYSGPLIEAPTQSDGRPMTAANLHALVPADDGHAAHRAVEAAAVEQAGNGMEDLVSRGRIAFATARVGVERTDADVVVDCWGVPLSFDEFLRTRIVEMVVHAEDLADSMALESSGLPDEAKELACNIGIAAAIRRNGPTSVLRALFRSDRHSTAALRPL